MYRSIAFWTLNFFHLWNTQRLDRCNGKCN